MPFKKEEKHAFAYKVKFMKEKHCDADDKPKKTRKFFAINCPYSTKNEMDCYYAGCHAAMLMV